MPDTQTPAVTPYHPSTVSNILINNESYIPTPHEFDPVRFAPDTVWHAFPWNDLWLDDPSWFSSLGEDQIEQRRIWSLDTPDKQADAFRELLVEFPERGLEMVFEAAVKGRVHVVEALLDAGVRASADEREGDDVTLVPLQAAAFHGHLDCVRVLVERGGVSVNHEGEMGNTPLIHAAWGGRVEVMEWLLGRGADIWARQTVGERTSVFEFAAGSGSVECVRLLLGRAGERRGEMLTPLALAAAAAAVSRETKESIGADTFVFLLEEMGYPLPDSLEGGVVLEQEQKVALEEAFRKALECKAAATTDVLIRYINSKDPTGIPNFPSLRRSTLDMIAMAFMGSMEASSPDEDVTFETLFNVFLSENPEYAFDGMKERRIEILNSAFIVAAELGNLDRMKDLVTLYPNIDVNAISMRTRPQLVTPLYLAAGSGNIEMLEWLFENFKDTLDPHKGNGKSINGPTALWIAIIREQTESVWFLLKHAHGPVDEVDPGSRPEPGVEKKLAIAAYKTYRNPIRLVPEAAADWTSDPETLRSPEVVYGDKGATVGYLTLSESDIEWWEQLQQRKSDEILKSEETFEHEGKRERRLMEKDTVEESATSSYLASWTGWMKSLWNQS